MLPLNLDMFKKTWLHVWPLNTISLLDVNHQKTNISPERFTWYSGPGKQKIDLQFFKYVQVIIQIPYWTFGGKQPVRFTNVMYFSNFYRFTPSPRSPNTSIKAWAKTSWPMAIVESIGQQWKAWPQIYGWIHSIARSKTHVTMIGWLNTHFPRTIDYLPCLTLVCLTLDVPWTKTRNSFFANLAIWYRLVKRVRNFQSIK